MSFSCKSYLRTGESYLGFTLPFLHSPLATLPTHQFTLARQAAAVAGDAPVPAAMLQRRPLTEAEEMAIYEKRYQQRVREQVCVSVCE